MALDPIEAVADVELLRGERADREAPPDLLVEVPHGADRRAHYDALRARLVGDLPDALHVFFHANTDLGAWHYGRRVAERLIADDPTRSALVIRCLLPRTFVDTNRLVGSKDGLASGGMTAGIPSYVRHPADRALLGSMHGRYVALIEEAYERVCGAGGFALMPHTYGPRTMAIAAVHDDIVANLRAAYVPETWAASPERPQIDLITKDLEGAVYSDEALTRGLLEAYAALGYDIVDSQTYTLHPSTQGARFATRFAGQTLGLEVRRDLFVERFELFEPLDVLPERADRIATPLADGIGAWLSSRRA